MSRFQMTAEKALVALQECAAARTRWGRQAAPPFRMEQLMEAIELVQKAGWLGKPQITEDDVVKLRRQLAAANARVARLAKKAGAELPELNDEE